MAEKQLSFLYKAASTLQTVENDNVQTLLRSYYLMRCKKLSKNALQSNKYLSSKVRCPRCCIEWRQGTQTAVESLNLRKKQRRRIRTTKVQKNTMDQTNSKVELLKSNKIKQICTFCKQTTVNTALKPEKLKKEPIKHIKTNLELDGTVTLNKKNKHKKKDNVKNAKETGHKQKESNIYTNSIEVFSLSNKKNSLESAQKVETKVIKNNKKKKDKFAGLCQKAVLATAKLKEEHSKQNKLNLFLKPSS